MNLREELVTSFGRSEIIGVESTHEVLQYLDDLSAKAPLVILSDDHILQKHPWIRSVGKCMIIPRGEEAKSLTEIEKAARQLIDIGLGRNAHLVSFGGGAVCDFTGFLASIYKRGVAYSHIPTTLLAQVDASIGGKNGVNIGPLKNMLGVFSAPQKIIVEPSLAFTQVKEDWCSGLAEVVKHALVYNAGLFDFLVENKEAIIHQDPYVVRTMVYEALGVKLDVVSKDDKESGLRKLLNFGHSIGHAIEREGGYRHGEAVAIGMIAELDWARRITNGGTLAGDEVRRLLKDFNLPTEVRFENDDWAGLFRSDKKAQGDSIDMILIDAMGQGRVQRYPIEDVLSFFQQKSIHGL